MVELEDLKIGAFVEYNGPQYDHAVVQIISKIPNTHNFNVRAVKNCPYFMEPVWYFSPIVRSRCKIINHDLENKIALW